MKPALETWSIIGFLASLVGCTAAVSEEPGGDESLASVRQASIVGTVFSKTKVEQDPDPYAFFDLWVGCPYRSMGLGSRWYASSSLDGPYLGFNRLRPRTPYGNLGADGTRTIWNQTLPDGDPAFASVQTVCTDLNTIVVSNHDGDGSAIAKCGTNWVTVAGGGACDDGAPARLTESRPTPNQDGANTVGWRATCDSGGVTAYAVCTAETAIDCNVEKVDPGEGVRSVTCSSGRVATAVGIACDPDTEYSWATAFYHDPDLSGGLARCGNDYLEVPGTAYAICCDSLAVDDPQVVWD